MTQAKYSDPRAVLKRNNTLSGRNKIIIIIIIII